MKARIAAVLVLMGLFLMTATARADFFDSGSWYMASGQWQEMNNWDTGNLTDLAPNGNQLDFTSGGFSTGEHTYRVYASKWAFDLSEDFEYNVDFHYAHTGTAANDTAQLGTGVAYIPGAGTDVFAAGVEAANTVKQSTKSPTLFFNVKKYFEDVGGQDSSLTRSEGLRGADDGMLTVRYNAEDDEVTLQASEDISGGLGEYDVVGELTYTGLRAYLEDNYDTTLMNVYLGGGSDGAALAGGEAYFKNFTAKGAMTPEPISSALFVLGAGALAAVKRLKRK